MSVEAPERPAVEPEVEDLEIAVTIESNEQLAAAALVIVAMTVIATAGFRTVFSGLGFLTASLAGAATGALVIMAGRRLRLLFGEILGLGLLVPLIIGPLAVGGVGFYQGLVFGWTDILTATPPVDATAELRALPFIAAFVGSLVGTELFRIRELPGAAVVGPLATLTLTALFSEQTRNGALAVGLVLLIGLLVLARLHYASLSTTGVLVLGLVVALVAGLASMLSLALPLAMESARVDLRDLQEPPWNPLELPSPLAELKAGLKLAEANPDPILRISGNEPVGRWRIASLPAYNGVYWGVAEPGQLSDFVPVDSEIPDIADEPARSEPLLFNVDVLAPIGPWVPVGGLPERLEFRDPTDARMSLATGTIGVPNELRAGDRYEIQVSAWPELTDTELGSTVFTPDQRSTELELLPPLVRNLAADFSTGLDQLSGRRVIAIRDNLRFGSYQLDHPPGHAFGQVAEFLQPVQLTSGVRDTEDLRSLVAYEELYTASGALLARLSDIPARVAVGYVIPEDRWSNRSAEVYAYDINAWVEVLVDGRGWVPIDVTPDRERQPLEIEEGFETEGVPVADPPKAPPEPEEDLEPVEEPEDLTEPDDEPPEPEEDDDPIVLSVARVAGIATGAALLLTLLAIGGVVAAKQWRRSRRRAADAPPARRIAGAWAELIDRIEESGGRLPRTASPKEAAEHVRTIDGLEDPDMVQQVETLADQVSISAFHPLPATDAAADIAWRSYDEFAGRLRESVGPAERLKRAVNPKTLRENASMGAR